MPSNICSGTQSSEFAYCFGELRLTTFQSLKKKEQSWIIGRTVRYFTILVQFSSHSKFLESKFHPPCDATRQPGFWGCFHKIHFKFSEHTTMPGLLPSKYFVKKNIFIK